MFEYMNHNQNPIWVEENKMVFEEVKFSNETISWNKGDVVEGELVDVKKDVGANKSTVYVIGEKEYWGASALDPMMSTIKVGERIRVTCVDDMTKFPSGRVGKSFKVEVDKNEAKEEQVQ